mmetsp:Transcript_21579/g.27232  ORF Transcript_21579/g.27232 Transcript_21579/m.27232 type:complete len:94 (-) Transcript_21579:189-470(-)
MSQPSSNSSRQYRRRQGSVLRMILFLFLLMAIIVLALSVDLGSGPPMNGDYEKNIAAQFVEEVDYQYHDMILPPKDRPSQNRISVPHLVVPLN